MALVPSSSASHDADPVDYICFATNDWWPTAEGGSGLNVVDSLVNTLGEIEDTKKGRL